MIVLVWKLSVKQFHLVLFVEQEVTQVLFFHSSLEDSLRLLRQMMKLMFRFWQKLSIRL